MMSYRIMIADDHPLAREAVRSVLETEPAFHVVGEAADGEAAVRLCGELDPDVALLDLNMPGMNGLEAARLIKQRQPHVRVVMLTVSDDVADLFTAIQYGAQGYLLKNMDPDEWAAYLIALLDDDAEVPRQMADKLFHRFRSPAPESASASASAASAAPLTPRERELALLVAAGCNNREIAEKLVISENTVKNHMKNILDKLGLDNRVQLTAYAIRQGWSPIGHNRSEK